MCSGDVDEGHVTSEVERWLADQKLGLIVSLTTKGVVLLGQARFAALIQAMEGLGSVLCFLSAGPAVA